MKTDGVMGGEGVSEMARWAAAIGEWIWCFGACAAIGATTGVAVDIAGPGVLS